MSLTDSDSRLALHRKLCNPKKRAQPGGIVAVFVFFEEGHQLAVEIVEVFGDPVGQVGVLRLRPHELDRIEFGRIRRQPAGPEPGATCSLQLGRGGAMRVQAVPNQEHGSPQVRMNKPKKCHQVNRMAVVVQQVIIEAKPLFPRSHRQGTNHAHAVMSVPAPQWLQQEATFIEKNNASFSFGSLFLAGATRPGATARRRPHRVREPDIQAFEGSSQVDAEASRRNRRGTPPRKVGRSALLRVGSSTPDSQSPNDRRPWPRQRASVADRLPLIAARGQDASASLKRRRRLLQNRVSSASRTTRPHQQPQPLSPMCPLAQEAGPRAIDELPAPRGCHEVS
jgi:hypothetical protein